MKSVAVIALTVAASIGLMLNASAQQKPIKDQLVGGWNLVSVMNVAPDGTKRPLFGDKPKGVLVLGADNRYLQVQVHPDRPRFKANNRLDGTFEEYRAVIAGAYASFGRWSVNESSKTLVRHVEGSATFPNEEGRDSSWIVQISNNQLRAEVTAASAGGTTELVFTRLD